MENSTPAVTGKKMSSLEIAETTGKRHSDVMRSIKAMAPAWEKVNGRKIALVEYTDAKGEKRPMYNLTQKECLYVSTKFNDEARAKLIVRWEQLEYQIQQPAIAPVTSTLDMFKLSAKVMEEHETAIKGLDDRLTRLEEKGPVVEQKELTPFPEGVGWITEKEYEAGELRRQGYQYREIGKILGISYSTVYNRVERYNYKIAKRGKNPTTTVSTTPVTTVSRTEPKKPAPVQYMTVNKYAKKLRLKLALPATGNISMRAKNICKHRSIEVKKVPNGLFGAINAYPVNVLKEVFAKYQEKQTELFR